MLLRFAFENFRSFRDRTEVSFVSTRLADEPGYRMPAVGAPHGVLPVLGVFGGNASGKSNLLLALKAMVQHVAGSFQLKPEALVPWAPFRMAREAGAPPTTFEVDFLVDGVRHHYGFRHTGAAFVEEWLYRWPARSRQVLFTRNDGSNDGWYFGPELTGAKKAIAEATRRNALFLSTAAQMNHPALGPVAAVLTRGCRDESGVELRGYPVFHNDAAVLQPGNAEVVKRLLRAGDLGVTGFAPRPARSAQIPPEAMEEIRASLTEAALARFTEALAAADPLMEVWLDRQDDDGTTWGLPPDLESRGTNVLLSRINDLLPVLAEGRLLIVDELDTSLHPDLCAALIGLFTTPEANPRGAQLLFSTHDRGLLAHLRRDEVLLVDKGRDGASRLAAASDFGGLRGREDLRRVHEQGRIGGVPVLGDLREAIRARRPHAP